jgi:uncharacterized protein YndB with AHSA1/START domain/ketosteroid isomerase-like protein
MHTSTLATVRAYHDAWTGHDFARATALLSDPLVVEVPVNHYPTTASFAAALAGFGRMVRGVQLLSATSRDDEAMLLYDLDVAALGPLRVAEHLTVRDGRIVRIRQIHDTEAVRAAGFAREHLARRHVAAPAEVVFDALTTLDGLAGWWTPEVSGSAETGGLLRFGFAGVDEQIAMRVDEARRPDRVRWTCLEHTGSADWRGSAVTFSVVGLEDGCRLELRHAGVPPALVSPGWDRFLSSVAALAECGAGSPFGT